MPQDLENTSIVLYELNELVDDMKLLGHSDYKIAEECNKKLAQRKATDPSFNPSAISSSHIRTYFKKKIVQDQLETTPQQLATLSTTVIDVNKSLISLKDKLEDELNKLRNYGAPVLASEQRFFIELVKQINKTIELAGNVQGRLGPSININVLSIKAEKLCSAINSTPGLDEATKQTLNEHVIANLLEHLDNDIKQNQIKDIKPNE